MVLPSSSQLSTRSGICRFCDSMGFRPPLFIQVNKHNFVNPDNGLESEFVPNLTADGNRCCAESDSLHTYFNNISQFRRAHKVNFGHKLRCNVALAKLANNINGSLFIDPGQNGSPEEGTVGIEIFWFDQLSAEKPHRWKSCVHGVPVIYVKTDFQIKVNIFNLTYRVKSERVVILTNSFHGGLLITLSSESYIVFLNFAALQFPRNLSAGSLDQPARKRVLPGPCGRVPE